MFTNKFTDNKKKGRIDLPPGLFFSIGVGSKDVVFSCTSVGSMIVDEP
jgi:hypothetical protein